jgi:hypothetical protein
VVKEAEFNDDQFANELESIQAGFRKKEYRFKRLKSEIPQLHIRLSDKLESILIGPLFDVHIGSPEHDKVLLDEHLGWIADTPNVFSFDGGDATENKTQHEAKMGRDTMSPRDQVLQATRDFGRVAHKLLFKLAGNHEDRTYKQAGFDSAETLAENLKIPYFGDYCFCTIFWRGNRVRLAAHHGAGGGQTPGSQRNAARKELVWIQPDILWTGHLHQTLTDRTTVWDRDQKTGEMYERDILVMISPSYLKYFGSYAAKKRMAPGQRGLSVIEIHENGRLDANVHARGKRI